MMYLPDFREADFADIATHQLARRAWGLCIACGATLQVGGSVPGYHPEDDFDVLGWGFVEYAKLFFVPNYSEPGQQRRALEELIVGLMADDGAELAAWAGANSGWLPEQRSMNEVFPDQFIWAADCLFGVN